MKTNTKTKSSEIAGAPAQSELVKLRFDQAVERASAALRELNAAAAGAVEAIDLKSMVDYLGHLKAQASTIEGIEDQLKGALVESGEPSIDGDLFHATIARFLRDKLDMDAVRAKLTPQFITAHTTQTPVTQVKVSARTRL